MDFKFAKEYGLVWRMGDALGVSATSGYYIHSWSWNMDIQEDILVVADPKASICQFETYFRQF